MRQPIKERGAYTVGEVKRIVIQTYNEGRPEVAAIIASNLENTGTKITALYKFIPELPELIQKVSRESQEVHKF